MAIPEGNNVSFVSNGFSGRTPSTIPLETPTQNGTLSNHILPTSPSVKFIMKCIAALDECGIEELAFEISNGTDDELVMKLFEETACVREAYGSSTIFEEVAKEYRRNRPASTHSQIECDLPHFDDPDFETKLHTDSAPLPERKKLFVRLWNTFETEDRRAFMSRVDPKGVFQRLAA